MNEMKRKSLQNFILEEFKQKLKIFKTKISIFTEQYFQ